MTFITAQVKVFQRFPQITARVEQAAKAGLRAAADEAALVAQANASIDLDLELVPVHGTVDGYSAGIKSRASSSRTRRSYGNQVDSSAPIAWFFDRGTLGERTRKLKRPRKETWTGHRHGSTYTAHRRDVEGKGIRQERFFGKARTAGRRKLLERIARI